MPIYQWECKHCKKIHEVINRMDDYDQPPEEDCCDERDYKKHVNASVTRYYYND